MHFIRTQGLQIIHDTVLLENASFTLSGRTGIVGDNGSGKSTLLRALSSHPRVFRSAPASLLTQEQDRRGTVAEVLGVSRTLDIIERSKQGLALPEELDLSAEDWQLPERLENALREAGLQIQPDRLLSTLSGGEMARLGIAALALQQPAITLLDEPTNHLDGKSRETFYEFVRSFPGTLIAASHDRVLLRLMEAVLELRPPHANLFGGNYDFYAREREKLDAAEEGLLRNAGRVLRQARKDRAETMARQAERQKQGRRRAPNAGVPGILLGKMKRRAEQTSGRLQLVHEDRVNQAAQNYAQLRAKTKGRRTVQIQAETREAGLCAALRGVQTERQGRPLWKHPLEFSVHHGERIWISGDNGSGKSTLCRLLMGFEKPAAGTVNRKARISMLDQFGQLWIADPGQEPHALAPPRFQGRPVMSGGERMHLLLRGALESGASALLLDEPTNHLDLERMKALAESLLMFQGGLVVVTHDADFAAEAGLESEFAVRRD